jgi:hypothetical protein
MWPDFMRAGLRTTRRALAVELGHTRSRSRAGRA